MDSGDQITGSVPEELITEKIFLIRRSFKRFPEDFMFQLTSEEMNNWISQIVISNRERMGLRKPPLAFTEQGVALLSSVLKSDRAIMVNIKIFFSRLNNSKWKTQNMMRRSSWYSSFSRNWTKVSGMKKISDKEIESAINQTSSQFNPDHQNDLNVRIKFGIFWKK